MRPGDLGKRSDVLNLAPSSADARFGTLQGLDWLWLFLAVVLDLASIVGSFFRKGLGISKDDLARMDGELDGGKAAVAVLAEPDEATAISAKLAELGGARNRTRFRTRWSKKRWPPPKRRLLLKPPPQNLRPKNLRRLKHRQRNQPSLVRDSWPQKSRWMTWGVAGSSAGSA